MTPTRRPFIQVASRICALTQLCILCYAQPQDCAPSTTTSSQHESLNEEELHQLIIKNASSIKDNLVQIRDHRSATASVSRLQHHYHLITVYLDEMHQRISNKGYNLLLIKEQTKESTRLFGKISILSRELLRCDAYGSPELAELLRKFCPEQQQAENSLVDPVGSIIQAQGLQSPASFIQAENMLTQLYNRLKKVQSEQAGMEQAETINDLVYALVEIDHLIKMTLAVSSTEETELAHEKLELIRHLGSLCHHEIIRIEEANFYGIEGLRSTILGSRLAVGNPINTPSHTSITSQVDVALRE